MELERSQTEEGRQARASKAKEAVLPLDDILKGEFIRKLGRKSLMVRHRNVSGWDADRNQAWISRAQPERRVVQQAFMGRDEPSAKSW